jgi:cation:H+ antiporter
MVAVILEARKQRSAAAGVLGERRGWLAVLLCLGGLALLITAGRLIVTGARGIATSFGLSEFAIGATMVAVGTSVPELATTIVAKVRKHDEVGLGTILGSNVFNSLLIIAVAAMVFPISVDLWRVGTTLGFGVVTVALTWPGKSGRIKRGRGLLLLALYAAFTATVLQR